MTLRVEQSLGNASVEEGKAEQWLNLIGIPVLNAMRRALNDETLVILSDASGPLDMEGSATLMVLADSTAGALSFELPEAKSGIRVLIKDSVGMAAAHNITITVPVDTFIDGGTSHVISTNYGMVWLLSDGDNWLIV